MTKLSQAIALATAMTAGLAATTTQAAEVEVAASASVANMYLWRGLDLGAPGVPAISGDLSVSSGGAYGGVWTSSGDTSAGQEYDVFVGYGMETGDVALDISYWAYVYPGADGDDIADLHEIVASAAYKGASLGVYYNIDQDEDEGTDYIYTTLGYGVDKFSATYGMTTFSDTEDSDYAHLDLSYAYNDNISFTLSQVVSSDLDEDEANAPDRSPLVVVSYSLPIEL
jgi:uncharacterized protein (TIGR02001 family)